MDIINPKLKQRKTRKKLLLGAGGLVALAAAVGLTVGIGSAMPTVSQSDIWVGTVKRGDMLQEVRATGTLVPRHQRWISAATSAQVETIKVWPGTTVQPDTVIMQLSNPEVAGALRNAKAKVAAAEADVAATRAKLQTQLLDERSALAQARADYASAKVKAEADGKAIKLNLVPRIRYEQELIALKQLKQRMDIEHQRVLSFAGSIHAQMAAVRAKLAQEQSNLTLRQHQQDALKVTAGITGVLQKVAVQEGSQVAEGAKLAQVARPDQLMARLKVPEVQAKDVALGMPVRVDTHNGIVNGTVGRIDPSVTQGNVLVDVNLSGTLPDGARPDLSVDGRIRIAQLKNVLSVGRPATAQADQDITLFRINADGIASRTPVRIGALSADRVQILKGLQPGDKVILSNTSNWDAYSRIKVR